jgi:mitochondrial fission protein ELM1
VITKGANLKVALRALNNKDNLGLLADESAKDGDYVSFFGRNVPAPAGPMAISYKTESPVIISLLVRKKGPYHRLTMDEPFYVKEKAEIHKYLQIYYDKLSQIIDKYPDQWLWVQKRWRLSRERNIVVFSDNKAGHFNQSIAVASWLKEELNKKGYRISLPYEDEEEIKTIQPVYKHKSCPVFLNIALRSKIYKLFAEKILAFCLTKESFDEIINIPADYIISCGNSLSALSAILKYINLCKNIVIMKPTISLAHYDLAVIPAHDSARRGKNIVITKAAPNLIDRLLCKGESSELKNKLSSKKTLSLFFGGDTQSFKYEDSFVSSLVLNLKKITEANDLNLLITTSRRTSKANEELFKKDLKAYNKCNLLIIANEKNPVNSAVAMLAASDLVLVTFDSISMISEAASSRAKVIVVLPDVLEKIKGFPKHKKLIKNFLESNLIDIATLDVLKETIEKNIASDNKSEILTEEKKVKESFSGIL